MLEDQKEKMKKEIEETLERIKKEEYVSGDLYSVIRWAKNGWLQLGEVK